MQVGISSVQLVTSEQKLEGKHCENSFPGMGRSWSGIRKEREHCGIIIVVLNEAEKRDGQGGLWRWTGM